MTVSLAGRAPATFEIKSANLPLVSLLLKSTDLAALAGELNARFGDIPDFFDNDPMVLDLTPLHGKGDVDFGELLHLLRGYKVMPVAVRGGDESQVAAALLKGLAVANEVVGLRQAQPERQESVRGEPEGLRQAQPERHESVRGEPEGLRQAQPERGESVRGEPEGLRQAQPERGEMLRPEPQPVRSEPQPKPGRPEPQSVRPEPVEGPPPTALVIDKPLRSGQQVYARGRDLIVMSMVNAGAEVIADGHIHIWAPLRGKAIAGARGNTEARIVAMSLEAELISIAGVYRTAEVPLPPELRGKPGQVRLVGGAEGKLVMDPLK